MEYGIILVIIIAFISLLFFYLTRKFWCWYFKIDELILLLEKQNKLLETQNKCFELILKNQNISLTDDIEHGINIKI